MEMRVIAPRMPMIPVSGGQFVRTLLENKLIVLATTLLAVAAAIPHRGLLERGSRALIAMRSLVLCSSLEAEQAHQEPRPSEAITTSSTIASITSPLCISINRRRSASRSSTRALFTETLLPQGNCLANFRDVSPRANKQTAVLSPTLTLRLQRNSPLAQLTSRLVRVASCSSFNEMIELSPASAR